MLAEAACVDHKRTRLPALILLLALAGLPNCRAEHHHGRAGAEAVLRLSASAFAAARLPAALTCDGANRSPAIAWGGAPPGVKSWVVSLRDPDAPGGVFTHWLLYSIPAATRRLPAGLPPGPRAPGFGNQGRNDFGGLGYGGPCPPRGEAHRYVLTLLALDAAPALRPGLDFEAVRARWQGHVMARAQLTGRYQRP